MLRCSLLSAYFQRQLNCLLLYFHAPPTISDHCQQPIYLGSHASTPYETHSSTVAGWSDQMKRPQPCLCIGTGACVFFLLNTSPLWVPPSHLSCTCRFLSLHRSYRYFFLFPIVLSWCGGHIESHPRGPHNVLQSSLYIYIYWIG